MTEPHCPDNPSDWADLLLGQVLPSPFRINQLVLRDLSGDRLSYAALAERIARDPILAWSVMSKANRSRPDGNATSKTLDHAISMIGIDDLKSLLTRQPFEKVSHRSAGSIYFMRTLSASLLAAYLGRQVCKRREQLNAEDVFWSCLFYGIPMWLMWRFATPEMRIARHNFWTSYQLPEVAERTVFGCTFMQIAEAVTARLAVPDMVRDCYHPLHVPTRRECVLLARSARWGQPPAALDDRDLHLKMNHPAFLVMLTNLMANSATHDWYSRATLRTQKMLAAYLHVPIEEAITISHIVAAKSSRRNPLPAIMLPAAKLLLPERPRPKRNPSDPDSTAPAPVSSVSVRPGPPIDTPAPTQQPTTPATNTAEITAKNATASTESTASTNTTTSTTAEEPAMNTASPAEGLHPLVRELTDAMLHRPEEFADLNAVMNAASEVLGRGIGFKRAVIMLVSKDQSRLKSYFPVGCNESPELARFETQIIRQTLFGKLCERAASVWVKPASADKLQKMVPMNFKQTIQVEDFFLMSIFVAKRPVAVLYADAGLGGSLTEQQYQLFKYLCGAIASALRYQTEKADG
jgi:hypothetical protein